MAKKFKLQSVLKHRKLMEDRFRQQMAEALRQEQSAKAALDQHRHRLRYLDSQLENQQQEGITVQDLWLLSAHLENQRSELKNLEAKVEFLEKKTADHLKDLQAASRKRQLLDNLKEKSVQEQHLEEQRQDACRMDELALNTMREDL